MEQIKKICTFIAPGSWWGWAIFLVGAPVGVYSVQGFISWFIDFEKWDMNNTQYYYIGVLVVFVIALSWRLYRVQKPKFDLIFDKNDSGCVSPGYEGDIERKQSIASYYFRLKVQPIVNVPLKNCKGYLYEIDRVDSDGTILETLKFDQLILHWGCEHFGATEIHGIPKYLDFATSYSRGNKLTLFVMHLPHRLMHCFNEPGIYRLKIQVVCDDMLNRATIEMHWNSKWDQIEAKMI